MLGLGCGVLWIATGRRLYLGICMYVWLELAGYIKYSLELFIFMDAFYLEL